jgi:hypothetical protein
MYLTCRYDMAGENGETRRQFNQRFGKDSPEVRIPEQGVHVWAWFWEVSARRRSGPEALSYGEVQEWQRMTCRDVLPVEVEMLMAMDDAYLRAVREEQKAARDRAMQPTSTG